MCQGICASTGHFATLAGSLPPQSAKRLPDEAHQDALAATSTQTKHTSCHTSACRPHHILTASCGLQPLCPHQDNQPVNSACQLLTKPCKCEHNTKTCGNNAANPSHPWTSSHLWTSSYAPAAGGTPRQFETARASACVFQPLTAGRSVSKPGVKCLSCHASVAGGRLTQVETANASACGFQPLTNGISYSNGASNRRVR